jgi:hypothetical protein
MSDLVMSCVLGHLRPALPLVRNPPSPPPDSPAVPRVIIVEPLALDRWRVLVVVLGPRPRVRAFEVTPRRALEVMRGVRSNPNPPGSLGRGGPPGVSIELISFSSP